jgi:CCR4-NOT transcription complex subunit 1
MIYKLVEKLNHETAYALLNSIINQLRFPNIHTKFFSQVILYIFKKANSLYQQMITRILMERLLVHKPHPWGILLTFAELERNPSYELKKKAFIRGNS